MKREGTVRRATTDDLDEITAMWAHYIRGSRENPAYRNIPPDAIEGSIARTAAIAWERAGLERAPAATVRGPRLPGGPGDVDLWTPLGDPGAAVGGWLLAAAWALRHDDGVTGPIELVAGSNNGEVAVAVLGTLPG